MSWVPVSNKSNKECTKVSGGTGSGDTYVAMVVKCTEVNLHYYRDFTTDDKAHDTQFDLAKAGEANKVFGFF